MNQFDFEEKPITYLMVDAEDIINTKIVIANYRFINQILGMILLAVFFLVGFGGALLLLSQANQPINVTPTQVKP